MKICFLLLGTSLSLIPSLTFAQCVATQDCETLGYTETSCNGGKGVKCPFGNKWACIKSDSECEQQFCDKYGFQYTCSGTGYSGGSGAACGDKYQSCTCASGYEWNGSSCQKQVLNGAQGELFYCDGKVVGVRATGMDFYVAMNDLGYINKVDAYNQCPSYVFCSNLKGILPTIEQLETLYNNKSTVNNLLSTHGGTQLINYFYWSSSHYNASGCYILHMLGGGRFGDSDDGIINAYARPILASW